MQDTDILILSGPEIDALLNHQELEIVNTVRLAYETHQDGKSSLPFSTFLRFPDEPRNRIIALPAYLGADFQVAGLKWISSFPGNLNRGLDRASAVIILNSALTGRPEAILEGSLISAKRTAASAALAARSLQSQRRAKAASMIGCGLINFEIARFLRATCPEVEKLTLFDKDPARAEHFKQSCLKNLGYVEVEIADSTETVLAASSLISIATTSSEPHLFDLSQCLPGSTILHISLRDLSPELILSHENIVDDIEHVCQAQTSVHLAAQLVGNTEFIKGTLAQVVRGDISIRENPDGIVIFSPFGLGVLDLAVSKLVCEFAARQGAGTRLSGFLPASWAGQDSTASSDDK